MTSQLKSRLLRLRGNMRAIFVVILCALLSAFLFNGELLAQARFGPYGGGGGAYFEDQIPMGSNIIEVQIRAGTFIDAIQILFRSGAQTMSFPRRGGPGGGFYSFVLQGGEFITGIRGRHGIYVDSIIICTNMRESPPYGGMGGAIPYQVYAPQGHRVVGFFGRSGIYVDAIGIITRP